MDLPAWAMASLDFAAVTNARGSDDNFPSAEDGPDAGPGQPTTRWKLAYSTLFYAALGLEPFFDVIWTRGDQPGHAYSTNRSNIELQAVVSALASRGVGIGDGPAKRDAPQGASLSTTRAAGASGVTPVEVGADLALSFAHEEDDEGDYDPELVVESIDTRMCQSMQRLHRRAGHPLANSGAGVTPG